MPLVAVGRRIRVRRPERAVGELPASASENGATVRRIANELTHRRCQENDQLEAQQRRAHEPLEALFGEAHPENEGTSRPHEGQEPSTPASAPQEDHQQNSGDDAKPL